jgi:hypothetical protein
VTKFAAGTRVLFDCLHLRLRPLFAANFDLNLMRLGTFLGVACLFVGDRFVALPPLLALKFALALARWRTTSFSSWMISSSIA